jgi:hypothetical protein
VETPSETREERRRRAARERMQRLRQNRRDALDKPFDFGAVSPAAPIPAPPPPPARIPVPCSVPGCPVLDCHSSLNSQPVCSDHVNGSRTVRTPQNAPAGPSKASPAELDAQLAAFIARIEARKAARGDRDPNAPSWWTAAGLDRAGGAEPFRLPDPAQAFRSPPIACDGQQFGTFQPGDPNLQVGSTYSPEKGHIRETDPAERAEIVDEYREQLQNADLSDADLHELLNEPVVSRIFNAAKATVKERNANDAD